MAMDWYVPDGTNHQIVELPEKKIADFCSPGGGTGAMIVTLTHLILYYNSAKYLIDLDMGELFGWIANQWRCTGLYCSTKPFIINELIRIMTCCSTVLQMDLEQEQQTTVIQLSTENGTTSLPLPLLPLMLDPNAYVQQQDVMTPNMRRNYVRDRTQAAITYITEYEVSQQLERDQHYDKQLIQQRLQDIYGRVDRVKQQIDAALHNDDIHWRRRVMRMLEILTCFPIPQNMKNTPINTWITWIREESNDIIKAIDEEIAMREDPDDPFDRTASGIFAPHHKMCVSANQWAHK